MKRFLVIITMSIMMLLFGFAPAYASEWSGGTSTGSGKDWWVNSGRVYTTSQGYFVRSIEFNISDKRVFPFIITMDDPLKLEECNLQVCNFGYVVIENGQIVGSSANLPDGGPVLSDLVFKDEYENENQDDYVSNTDLNLWVGSEYTTNMPIFGTNSVICNGHTFTEEALEFLKAYYIDGNYNMSGVYYSPEGALPEFGEFSSIEDSGLGYLYNVRSYDTHYWKTVGSKNQQNGNKALNEKYGDGYLFTWDCYNVSGSAIQPGTQGPISQYDTLYTRVQVKMDMRWHYDGFMGKDEEQYFNPIDVFTDFSDFPYFYSQEYHFKSDYLEKRILSILETKSNYEKYVEKGSTQIENMFLRVVYYNPKEEKYYVSPRWTRVAIHEYGGGSDIEEGTFDEDGYWVPDPNGKDYHLNSWGNIENGSNLDNDMLTDEDKDTMLDNPQNVSFSFDTDTLSDIATSFNGIPALLSSMFAFVPGTVWILFGLSLVAIIIMRILGR